MRGPGEPWQRKHVTTEMLLLAVHRYGIEACTILRGIGIPGKVLLAAIERDTRAGWITYGVSAGRPFLDTRGRGWINSLRTDRTEEKDVGEVADYLESEAATRRAPALVRAAEKARDAWEPEAVPAPGADLCHQVEIRVIPAGLQAGVVAVSVTGGNEVVAAALRAYADKICPVKPPPAAHRPVRHAAA